MIRDIGILSQQIRAVAAVTAAEAEAVLGVTGGIARDPVSGLRGRFYVSVRLARRRIHFYPRTNEGSCKREKLFPLLPQATADFQVCQTTEMRSRKQPSATLLLTFRARCPHLSLFPFLFPLFFSLARSPFSPPPLFLLAISKLRRWWILVITGAESVRG